MEYIITFMILAVQVLLVTVFLPTSAALGFSLTGERRTGEYDGLAVMRCSWQPRNSTIEIVEWRKGLTGLGDLIYYEDFNTKQNLRGTFKDRNYEDFNTKQNLRGTFKDRNVTGRFGKSGLFHDLVIYRARSADASRYICRVKSESESTFKETFINLTLVAPPDKPPVIVDERGVIQKTSNCSDVSAIPLIPAKRKRVQSSFLCKVGGSNPYPAIEWHYEGSHTTHETVLTADYESRGVRIKAAERRMDFTLTESKILNCTVAIPSATSGEVEYTYLCIRIADTNYDAIVLGSLAPLPVILCILLTIYWMRTKDDD